MAMPTTPIGRFTRKIERQPNAPTSSPPTVGPTVRPVATTAPLIPKARPRSSLGKTALVIARPFAWSIAAPTAWATRERISCSGEAASPQRSEPSVKTPKPMV